MPHHIYAELEGKEKRSGLQVYSMLSAAIMQTPINFVRESEKEDKLSCNYVVRLCNQLLYRQAIILI